MNKIENLAKEVDNTVKQNVRVQGRMQPVKFLSCGQGVGCLLWLQAHPPLPISRPRHIPKRGRGDTSYNQGSMNDAISLQLTHIFNRPLMI